MASQHAVFSRISCGCEHEPSRDCILQLTSRVSPDVLQSDVGLLDAVIGLTRLTETPVTVTSDSSWFWSSPLDGSSSWGDQALDLRVPGRRRRFNSEQSSDLDSSPSSSSLCAADSHVEAITDHAKTTTNQSSATDEHYTSQRATVICRSTPSVERKANYAEKHSCSRCNRAYSTQSNLARHMSSHKHDNNEDVRQCPQCDKRYRSLPAYTMHVRTHSQGCQCPHCGKCFSRPWLLQGHIRTHTGERPFRCVVCDKAFADKSNLRAHVQTHSSVKPHVCGRCGKAFALKSYLYKHEESSCMKERRQVPTPKNHQDIQADRLTQC